MDSLVHCGKPKTRRVARERQGGVNNHRPGFYIKRVRLPRLFVTDLHISGIKGRHAENLSVVAQTVIHNLHAEVELQKPKRVHGAGRVKSARNRVMQHGLAVGIQRVIGDIWHL